MLQRHAYCLFSFLLCFIPEGELFLTVDKTQEVSVPKKSFDEWYLTPQGHRMTFRVGGPKCHISRQRGLPPKKKPSRRTPTLGNKTNLFSVEPFGPPLRPRQGRHSYRTSRRRLQTFLQFQKKRKIFDIPSVEGQKDRIFFICHIYLSIILIPLIFFSNTCRS